MGPTLCIRNFKILLDNAHFFIGFKKISARSPGSLFQKQGLNPCPNLVLKVMDCLSLLSLFLGL